MGPRVASRCAVINVPPLRSFGENAYHYGQIKRSFYLYFFQTQVAEEVVAANDFAFVDDL